MPNFGEHKKNKRKKFLNELALALIIPHARQRLLEVQQTPQDVKQIIRSCVVRFSRWGQIDPMVPLT
jgi:hypothetical protein